MQVSLVVRCAVASALSTAAVIGTSVALAGSGIGGGFNLGETNTVNETSTLTGAKAGAQLQVTNSSTAAQAAGLAVNVASGRPPLVVNRNTRIPNLNADLLDGYHASWLSRAAMGSTSTLSV